MNRTTRLIWNESFNFANAIYQLKSSVKQYVLNELFFLHKINIYQYHLQNLWRHIYVIYHLSLRGLSLITIVVMISFSNKTPHQLTRQNWLKPGCQLYCPDFIDKDSWPPSSPDLNQLDFHRVNPKSHNTAQLKEMLKDIRDKLRIDSIRRSVLDVQKRLQACVKADGEHLSR